MSGFDFSFSAIEKDKENNINSDPVQVAQTVTYGSFLPIAGDDNSSNVRSYKGRMAFYRSHYNPYSFSEFFSLDSEGRQRVYNSSISLSKDIELTELPITNIFSKPLIISGGQVNRGFGEDVSVIGLSSHFGVFNVNEYLTNIGPVIGFNVGTDQPFVDLNAGLAATITPLANIEYAERLYFEPSGGLSMVIDSGGPRFLTFGSAVAGVRVNSKLSLFAEYKRYWGESDDFTMGKVGLAFWR